MDKINNIASFDNAIICEDADDSEDSRKTPLVEKVETVEKATSSAADEGPDRAQWENPTQFFMTFLGFCFGLGNIWRFPYLCQQNGGGKLAC
jgi:hypothetical protein